jgi:hypothetical protein
MMNKIILITASMGVMAFGFLCYMQGEYILTELNNITCFDDGTGLTSLWIPDLVILVFTSIVSTLCFSVVVLEVQK